MPSARRVTVIAHELRGFHPAGGMGTATTFVALALARMGHSVEILLGKHAPDSIDPHWASVYAGAGVRIRPVPHSAEPVEPWHFAHAHSVSLGLQADPPDVVIAHDFGAPAYSALRLRQAGIAFDDTLFVVLCHGTRRYVAGLSPDVAIGDLPTVVGVGLLEQASVELADVVVSPSAYLVGWMRDQGWQLPERTLVIPYFTRSEATGEPVSTLSRPDDDPIKRLVFFGRVDEKKGVALFAAALNALEPDIEVELVGKTTRTWTRERVAGLFANRVTFATDLDQREALDRLRRPGTLVVMPSLQENSPNTVYECLEEGIPFLASNVGGVPELIAANDRARVLFEPTVEGIEAAIRRVLDEGMVPAPALPAFERETASERWAEVIARHPPERTDAEEDADEPVDVVILRRGSQEALLRCVATLEDQDHRTFDVLVADTRRAGLDQGSAPYVVFLDEEDVPDPGLLQTLLAARQATGADVVTSGLRLDGKLHFFAGEPGGLGAVTNAYGNVALFRREVLGDVEEPPPGARDADWPLLARLALEGATIVSVPLPLVRRRIEPGTAENDPAAALLVVQQIERTLPDPLRGSARLAAGLAANAG